MDGSPFALPTGTVTFLLTDVESSTRQWEAAPESMAVAIARHYAILEEAITGHGGVRPVEQGEGDSVVGAFSRASDAVGAALDAQRALATEDWPAGVGVRVRMAIHTGEAQLRDEGNYFGQTVIRCARLRAIGHGGQVLVSASTAALVGDRLPEGVGLRDLGTHRLKDLGRPERVWQLLHPELVGEFPPPRSLDVFRHNLPVQLTPLVGRQAEVSSLRGLLGGDRLVTLTGSGGVGKTRLALAVSAEVVENYPEGVWLVELAGIADGEGVVAAALAAVGAMQVPGVATVEGLVAELRGQTCLMVLDNCEHLVDSVAQVVGRLLETSVGVTVLATSREPLDVPGEVIWRVPSLDAPPAEATPSVPAVSQYDAVQLFADRARRAHPSFTITDDNAAAVAQICYRLDGIPLALELAAARCRQLTVERIAHDLDDRFRLLTGSSRTALPRQQTLAASIDWSHDRLDSLERVVLRRLSVFAGSFPLEAAEGVIAALSDVEPVAVFDYVSRLVDKSLVQATAGAGGDPRYRLLETVRAYAWARAGDAGEGDRLRSAHVEWWLAWLRGREPLLHTDLVVEQVEEFHDNLKAALDGSLDNPALGLELLALLARPWQNTGRHGEAMPAVDRLLTEDNEAGFPRLWARAALRAFVLITTARGPTDALRVLGTAKRLAGEIGDDLLTATAQWFSSGFSLESCARLREVALKHGERYPWALSVVVAAQTLALAGDFQLALAQLDYPEAVEAARESSYLRDAATRVRALAALGSGDLGGCIRLAGELTNTRSLLMVESAVGLASQAALLARNESALRSAVEIGEERLHRTPATAVTADRARHRLGLLSGAPASVPGIGQPDSPPVSVAEIDILGREALSAGDQSVARSVAAGASERGDWARAAAALIEGHLNQDPAASHEALALAGQHNLRLIGVDALEAIAIGAAESESWAECLRLARAAEGLREETGYQWRFHHEQEAIDRAVTSARSALGPEAADTAEAEGSRMAWQEAVAYARRARGERRRPSHGWASLTPTETQVVGLVAEGFTNPQIAERLLMGRATVKTHLEHVFAKLGVSSRAELAAQAARQG